MPGRPDKPSLSVVMPVHNALPHLDSAVRSVLEQTYSDFEFVIYDDASTDGSTRRLREWAETDHRIRLFEGARNLGPVGSSKLVVECSTAPLVARMDADDVSAPNRLARQVQLLAQKPDAGLVGTLFEIIDGQDRVIRGPDYWRLAQHSVFAPFAAHGSIMFHRSLFDQVGGYRAEAVYWEDQDLVRRMAAAAEAWVIPDALYQVRQWLRNGPALGSPEKVESAVDLMYRCVARMEQGQGYEDLLMAGPSAQSTRLDPRVFVAAGSKQLWAGARPKMLGRLLRRGRLRFDRRSLVAIVWTSWATVSQK